MLPVGRQKSIAGIGAACSSSGKDLAEQRVLLTRLVSVPKLPPAAQPRDDEKGATQEGGTIMSQPFSRFLHPFDVVRHPSLEPEVKRALLASWASDRAAVRGRPALRKPPGAKRAVPVDDVLAALRTLDRGGGECPPTA